MLMNNLDAEVAENPQELVVYGGIGRAARDWRCYDVLVETLKRLGDDETLCVQSGKPVGVFQDPPRRAARADRQLQPGRALGDLGQVPRARSHRPDDVRPDDRGLLDLHRQPGDHPGHLRDLRRGGRQHYGGDLSGQMDPDRRARRHGRRAAARRDHGRRVPARGGVPGEPDRAPPADPLSRPDGDRPGRGAGDDRAVLRGEAAGVGRPARQRRRGVPRAGAPRRAPRHRDRPDRGARSAERLSAGRLDARAVGGDAGARPGGGRARRQGVDGVQVRAMLEFHRQGVPTLDYGNNIRQFAKETGVDDAFVPGLRAGLHPADVLPRQGAVPLGRALGRSRGHLPDRRQGQGAVPGRCASAPLAGHGARADRVSGPAGADLLAGARRARQGRARVQRHGGDRASSRRRW